MGLSILIVGIPFVILFFGSVRVLSLVEGRMVEVMLGERMPRRPLYASKEAPLVERIKAMFIDPRTWGTMAYMLLMLPLGIVYFTLAVTLLSVSAGFIATPLLALAVAVGWTPYPDFQLTGVAPGRCRWSSSAAWCCCSPRCTSHAAWVPCTGRSPSTCWCGPAPPRPDPRLLQTEKGARGRPFFVATPAQRAEYVAKKSRTFGYTCVRQRRPLKMP